MEDVFVYALQLRRSGYSLSVRATSKSRDEVVLAIACIYVLFAGVFSAAVDADEDHEELHDMMKFKEFKVSHFFA